MIEYQLSNINENATVAKVKNFHELNKANFAPRSIWVAKSIKQIHFYKTLNLLQLSSAREVNQLCNNSGSN